MSKIVKFVEVVHQWEGVAIVKEEGVLKEVSLGVVHTDKKLKGTGVKNLFVKPEGCLAIEVKQNVDVTTVYELDSEIFKTHAKVVKQPTEETPTAEPKQETTV